MADSKSLKLLQKFKIPSPKVVRSPAFKVILLHLTIFTSLFSGLGFLVGKYELQNSNWGFLIVSSAILVLGVAHVWVLYSAHDWSKRMHVNGMKELLFTFGIYIAGIIGFTLALNLGSFSLSNLTAATTIFLFPFIWDKAFYSWLEIPKKELPAFIIENLEQYRGQDEIVPSKKALFIQFIDSDSSLPSEPLRMYMPKNGEIYSLKRLLNAFLLYYKYNVDSPTPIRTEYLKDGKKTFYEWQLFGKNKFSKQIILNPDKTIKGNKLKYKKWQGDDKDGRAITVDYVELFIKRF